VTGHGVGTGLKLATKKQVRLALIVGVTEQQATTVSLHDLVTGEERVLDLESLAGYVFRDEEQHL
jgi:histidyl-tRNA synthetase